MSEPDWKQILSLGKTDFDEQSKDSLYERLAWLELDGVDINLEDLKALFSITQGILKHKGEQVSTLIADKESTKDSGVKSQDSSPSRKNRFHDYIEDSKINIQEKVLERHQTKIGGSKVKKDKLTSQLDSNRESDSSVELLTELSTISQLKYELNKTKNYIQELIKKLTFSYDENKELKEKVFILKEKLKEATICVENLTKDIVKCKNEYLCLKNYISELDVKNSELKANIALLKSKIQSDDNKQKLYDKNQSNGNIMENDLEKLININMELKEEIEILKGNPETVQNESFLSDELKKYKNIIQVLEERLEQATDEIRSSTMLIDFLSKENFKLKINDDHQFSCNESEMKNKTVSKDVKPSWRNHFALETTLIEREKQLAEVSHDLHRFQEGSKGLHEFSKETKKFKKELIKKDDYIRQLVKNLNAVSQNVEDYQLENIILREKLQINKFDTVTSANIPAINARIERRAKRTERKLFKLENVFTNLLIKAERQKDLIQHLKEILRNAGIQFSHKDKVLINRNYRNFAVQTIISDINLDENWENSGYEIQNLICENDSLRQGLNELLDSFKTFEPTDATNVVFESPSLSRLASILEARYAAGWFAPHIAATMRLQRALGEKDTLIKSLSEAKFEIKNLITKINQKAMDEKASQSKEESIEIIFQNWIEHNFENYNEDLFSKVAYQNVANFDSRMQAILLYFYNQFCGLELHINATILDLQTQQQTWSAKEDNYKAETLKLKAKIESNKLSHQENGCQCIFLQRKCEFLEDNFKFLKTKNEDHKNEMLEKERELIRMKYKYEGKIQRLLLNIALISQKLKYSVSLNLFRKLFLGFENICLKYRHSLDNSLMSQETDKKESNNNQQTFQHLFKLDLEEEYEFLQQEKNIFFEENIALREKNLALQREVDIISIELREGQHKEVLHENEVNMMRHLVLDVQSLGEEKTIIARLGTEIIQMQTQNIENHKKIDCLSAILVDEIEKRSNFEEMTESRDRTFCEYLARSQQKQSILMEIVQEMKQEYHGSIPTVEIERFIDNIKNLEKQKSEFELKSKAIFEKDISLNKQKEAYKDAIKEATFECKFLENKCPHDFQLSLNEKMWQQELKFHQNEIENLKNHNSNLKKDLIVLQQKFILLNSTFNACKENNTFESIHDCDWLEKNQSDNESIASNKTFDLPYPKVLNINTLKEIPVLNFAENESNLIGKNTTFEQKDKEIQTNQINLIEISVQTEPNTEIKRLTQHNKKLNEKVELLEKEGQIAIEAKTKFNVDLKISKEKNLELESTINILKLQISSRDAKITHLEEMNEKFRNEMLQPKFHLRANHSESDFNAKIQTLDENHKKTVNEYTELLNNERRSHSFRVNEMQTKLNVLLNELNELKHHKIDLMFDDDVQKKVNDLESDNFQLKRDFKITQNEFSLCKSELDRWKTLAAERLSEIEQINANMKKMHLHEIESLKTENKHWISELQEWQNQNMQLKDKLSEQKISFEKIIQDKIEIIQNIMSSKLKPTRKKLKEPSTDLVEMKEPLNSSLNSLETLNEDIEDLDNIEENNIRLMLKQLRSDKQELGKQNIILRRQINVLISREKRARLEAQSTKDQMIRLWHQREEKRNLLLEQQINEIKNLKLNLNACENTLRKLEQENKSLKSKVLYKKQTFLEKNPESQPCESCKNLKSLPDGITIEKLMQRIEAQQRRIVALELADKGVETLVSEYEKLLSKNTIMRGEILRFESQLLQSNIHPSQEKSDEDRILRELEHMRSYSDVLKEENEKLLFKLNSRQAVEGNDRAVIQRIRDLEQTVLMLRSLVSKLQTENRVLINQK